ncbi:MAG: hypothetical protein J5950_00115, partial [Clostridia bacterium]|nr:hypothetical protein [Clostridia bacterium]
MSDNLKNINDNIENAAEETVETVNAAVENAAGEAAESVNAIGDAAEEAAEAGRSKADKAAKKAEKAAEKAKKAAEKAEKEAEKEAEGDTETKPERELTAEEKRIAKADKKLQRKFDEVDKKFTWRRLLKILIPLLIILLIAFIILKTAFGNNREINFKDDSASYTDPAKPITTKGINGQLLSDSGMTVFADNGKLQLAYSPREDLFIVQEKATGRVYRSYPEPIYSGTVDADGNEIESDIGLYSSKTETGQILTSPVFIEYTKSGLEGGFTKGINQMSDVVKSVYFIENGVQLLYEVGELELSFIVEITIEDNALVYRIPFKGIDERETLEGEQEDRRPLLAALAVLPYFGAHRDGESGYFVTPDGCGALTYFDVARVSNYSEYSKKIYGIDATFDLLDAPDYSNEKLTMGAFGIVDDEYMLTAFIDKGEANAELKIGNPGVKSLPFYSIYFEYTYRYFYRMSMTKGGEQYEMVIKDAQLGDVEEHIYFVSDTSFNEAEKETAYTYVDVAMLTRDLLLEKWENVWNIKKTRLDEASSPLNLRFFMGAENKTGGIWDDMKVATSYKDVRSIYEELEKEGVSDLKLTLLGWMNA